MCLSNVTSTEMVYDSIPKKAYKCFCRFGNGLYRGMYHGVLHQYDIGEWYKASNSNGWGGIPYYPKSNNIQRPIQNVVRLYPAGFHSFESLEDARIYSKLDPTIESIVLEIEYKTTLAKGLQGSLPCVVHYDMKLIKEVPDDSV